MTEFAEGNEHPQGDKMFNGKIHQCFGHQNISKVEGGKLNVVHRTSIEDGLYEPEGDYTTLPLVSLRRACSPHRDLAWTPMSRCAQAPFD